MRLKPNSQPNNNSSMKSCCGPGAEVSVFSGLVREPRGTQTVGPELQGSVQGSF